MKRYKLSRKICEKLQFINEKYHILCFDLEFDDLDEFFEICENLALEPEDRYGVEYAYNLYHLCSFSHETEEGFREESSKLFHVYMSKLMKLEELNAIN